MNITDTDVMSYDRLLNSLKYLSFTYQLWKKVKERYMELAQQEKAGIINWIPTIDHIKEDVMQEHFFSFVTAYGEKLYCEVNESDNCPLCAEIESAKIESQRLTCNFCLLISIWPEFCTSHDDNPYRYIKNYISDSDNYLNIIDKMDKIIQSTDKVRKDVMRTLGSTVQSEKSNPWKKVQQIRYNTGRTYPTLLRWRPSSNLYFQSQILREMNEC